MLLVASPGSIGAYTIDWGDGSPVQSGASLVPPASVSHIYTAAVAEYTVVFTETATGCTITGTLVMEESTSASIQIPVGGLTQVCAPQAVEFVNSSTNTSPNTVFTWDFGDGSPLLEFDHTNLGQTVSHTYLQGTVNCETTVRLYAENSCNTLQGGPSIATFNPIRVWDLDEAQIAPSATLLCWPDRTVTFQNTTERNCLQQGNIFQRQERWNFGDHWGTGQDSIIGWTAWPPSFPRTLDFPGIGTYTVQLMDSNYCGIDSTEVTITIVPPPDVELAVTPALFCAGETAFFTATMAGGANVHSWNFGTGGGWQSAGPGGQPHTFATPGTFTVRYAASILGATAGCADTASVTVTVLPSPTAQFTLDQDAACNLLVTDPTNTSLNGVAYSWDFGDGSTDAQFDPPPHTYPVVGDHTITLTVTNAEGCADQSAVMVHVYDPPTVQIGAQNVCVGEVAAFSDQSVTAPGNPVVAWAWDLGDGTTDSVAAPTHLYAAPGTYVVSLVATTPYCSSAGALPVTVEAKPTAAFAASPTLGCSPLTVSFTNTSAGAVSHSWDFGDGAGSTELSPTHTFINLGPTDSVRTVRLIVGTAAGCTDTAFVDVVVSPAVQALFSHDALPGCAPVDVQFTNASTGANAYSWDFGDGTTSNAAAPAHQYVNNGLFLQTYSVTLVATAPVGCTDTVQQSITVYPAANFAFAVEPDSGCAPFTLTFPQVPGAVAYQWDFGDGSGTSGASPSHTYLNTGLSPLQYPVTLIATNAFGCSATLVDTITVHPAPVAQFSISDVQGCHPHMPALINTSIGAAAYTWSYGDGTSSATAAMQHTHTWYNFLGPGSTTFPVTLTAVSSSGCSAAITQTVQVHPLVEAAFNAPAGGCSPLTVQLAQEGSGATQWLWQLGDGSVLVGGEVTHTYVNTGSADEVFAVTLVATSAFGCTDTATAEILVHPVPDAAFQVSPIVQQFPAATIDITNTTAPGPWTYGWDFGDGTGGTAQDPMSHTYGTWGTFNVQLVVANGACTDTTIQAITITPPLPTAGFIGQGEGCAPLGVQFTNTSLLGETYQWDFGDGGTSQAEHPYYTWNTPGTYTVTLTVTAVGGGVNTAVKVDSIVVHPRAAAFFALQPDEVLVPSQPVITFNLSTDATSFIWDFGDGTTSTALEPTHYYQEAGQYTVTLVANNVHNCPDTFRLEDAVTGLSAGSIAFPNAFTPGNSGPSDGVYDPLAYDNNIFHPVFEGVEEYLLQVFNRWGELVFESDDVHRGWDGYYRGQPAKQDVYAWKARARFSNGKETTMAGDVTLLR
jgi:gliding motility-associated-like protein